MRYVQVVLQVKSMERKSMTIADIFRKKVAENPNKIALILEDKEWTFAQV